VAFMVLDQSAAETSYNLPELSNHKPGLTTKLLSVINGKND